MKYECLYCQKIISNPLIKHSSKGIPLYFCNKEHEWKFVTDELETYTLLMNFMYNPIFQARMLFQSLKGATQ